MLLGAKEVYTNTSPAPEKRAKILLRRQNGVYKYFRRSLSEYFSCPGEVFLYMYLYDTSQAPEKPRKYLYTSFRLRYATIRSRVLVPDNWVPPIRPRVN